MRKTVFIDNTIEDMNERALNWAYNVHAEANMWQNVLKDKWALVDYYQRGE